MPKQTHYKILDFLARNGSASAAQISTHLQVSRENIQYHLKLLQEEGTIISKTSSPPYSQRGRPVIFYQLASLSNPQLHRELIQTLLEIIIFASKNKKTSKNHWERIANILTNSLISNSLSLPARLRKAANVLNHWGFQAKWEAHKDGPRLFLLNCPYESLKWKRDDFCQLDELILTNMIGMKPETLSQNQSGKCTFQFILPANE